MMKGIVGIAVFAALMVSGCMKSDNPVNDQSQTPVTLSVAFTAPGGGSSLMKTAGIAVADSIRIDSAIVVLHRIKFESHIEDVVVDGSGPDTPDVESEDEMNVTFWGPFVIHVRDTVAIDFAGQTLPAGTYNGIKFKIHRLLPGEKHDDSDEHNGHFVNPNADTSAHESSIVVWGEVYKNGAWEPFTFKFDGEFEFKIEGNFEVPEAVGSVNIALSFDMGLWFRNRQTGELLDPTDTSITNYELFRQAIKHSFETGEGGHDDDDDGHPDD